MRKWACSEGLGLESAGVPAASADKLFRNDTQIHWRTGWRMDENLGYGRGAHGAAGNGIRGMFDLASPE